MANQINKNIDKEALRKKYNPEGSDMRKHQLRMLDILIEVDKICKRHDIPYWLSGGTLLGAVWFQGFMPWDDDIDIELMHKDYKRLMKALDEELPDNMALQTPQNDKNYFFHYAKVRDKKSFIAEVNHYDRVFKHQGIYIDIFPLRKQPLWLHRLSEISHGHAYKIMNRNPESDKDMWKVRLIKQFNRKFFYPILSLFTWAGKRTLINDFGIPDSPKRKEADIYPLKSAEFEGQPMPIPQKPDKVLTLQYDDYGWVPEDDNMHPHIEKLEFYE